jgi:hypothetical protein
MLQGAEFSAFKRGLDRRPKLCKGILYALEIFAFFDFKLTFLPTYRMPTESHAWSVYLHITPFSKPAFIA